jgi:phosphatidylglycerophosphate synthase
MAHAITALRVLLTVPLVAVIGRAFGGIPAWTAVPLFAVIAASDVLDGRVARATGAVSPWGRAFDHGADITFVLAALGTFAWIGVAPWYVPLSVAAAFAGYLLDSRSAALPTRARRTAGRIGHWGGVCNYVVIGVLIGNETLAIHALPQSAVRLMLAAVPLYSLAPVAVRRWPWPKAASVLTVR